MATRALKTVEQALDEIDKPIHPNLSAALVAAQAEMTAPRKDREVTVKLKTGGSYKFSYATMGAMVDADKPILARHGLAFVQFVSAGQMVTRIIHEGGDHLDCPLPMPNLPNAPQEAGSIITYFKRYSYSAAFGRVADEEDDANIAEGNGYTPTVRANPTTGETPPKKRVTLDGPYTCPTQLMAAAREFVRTLNGIGDLAEFVEWKQTKDVKEFVNQLRRDMPDWWSGGPSVPADFVPLEILVSQKKRDLEQIDGLKEPQ